MSFDVRFSAEAQEDLERLFDFLLESARSVEELDVAQAAVDAIRSAALNQLAVSPFSFRKAGRSPTRRELIIPFGTSGYVALYEVAGRSTVVVLAVRHQREEDYH
ncbi:MAG: type II toxin-antitoxin system RelE/ParE family toxin [Burkholderiales bacterium]|nr:type II toxin-antitoxin system RelE/ParE family toxin [Burkholderiales bacterium]